MSGHNDRFKLKQIKKYGSLLCPYCGDKFFVKDMEVDHVIAKSKGGKGGPDNLVMACSKCNGYKHNLSLEEFLEKAETRHWNLLKSLDYWRKVVRHTTVLVENGKAINRN